MSLLWEQFGIELTENIEEEFLAIQMRRIVIWKTMLNIHY